MAKIGLDNLKYGVLTEGDQGQATYGTETKLAKAVEASVEITNNEAVLYADNGVAESDYSFNNGTITLTIDDGDDTVFAQLLGHTVSDGEMIRSSNDTAPYVGLGRIIQKVVGGVQKYKVEFLKKVKFQEPSQSESTKGENVEFSTTEIVGAIMTLSDGTWSVTQTFDTKQEAITYLSGLFVNTSV